MNPTFDPIAKAGAMHDYFRGNPDAKQPWEFLVDREPIPAEYREPEARVARLDEFGLEAVWLFPTLGMLYEELLKHDGEAVTLTFTAFNRWLDEDWGCNYRDRIFAAPYISLCDLDWAVAELEWAIGRGARTVVMRPAAPHTADGQFAVSDPRFDPFWARVQEAGITVVAHAGDSGYSSNGYAVDGFAAAFSGGGRWAPTIKSFAIERAAYDFLITLEFDKLFDRFPGVRIASVENGSEFLRDLFNKLRSTDRKMPGYFGGDPCEVVPPQRVDQPVLGGRRRRGRRAHGRGPRDLRLRLAAHRRDAAAPRLRDRAQALRRRRPQTHPARQRPRAEHAPSPLGSSVHSIGGMPDRRRPAKVVIKGLRRGSP